jgi:hypothetical protein
VIQKGYLVDFIFEKSFTSIIAQDEMPLADLSLTPFEFL